MNKNHFLFEFQNRSLIPVLYIDLRPGQNMLFQVIHTFQWQLWEESHRQTWLKKWDKVKIPWYTHRPMHRKWTMNCMTVISAWWQSNMPFQRLSGRLNYYTTRWGQEVSELDSDELETSCGRESHHPAEEAFGTPDSVGDQMSWWEDAGMRTCRREAGPSVEQP